MSIKITAFEAENVKRIKAVQLRPDETGLTLIGGRNNQGKTSVLDAIAWALGGNKYRPDAAQRDGSVNPPHLRLRLSNGLLVERKGVNSTLTVTDPTGRKGGQQILDEFVEQLALDLPKFMQASDREKADILLRVIGVGDRLQALDRDIKGMYNKRTTIGQIATAKRKHADEMTVYEDAPDEPVSVSDLIRQQQEILARNGENQRKRNNAYKLQAERNILAKKVNSLREELDRYTQQLMKADEDMTIAFKTAEELQDESTAELESSIRNIEEINRQVRANLDHAHADADAMEYAEEYKQLSDQIDRMRRDRMALLDGAHLPLPELDVQDGLLLYRGKHWRDMSGSDQLRVATAIVRQLNPDCGFVLLDKLEQMDLETLAEFGDWLTQEGLQAIATRVSTGDECQIIIEDGRVADKPPESAPAQAWTRGKF